MKKTSLILMPHGSKNPEWAVPFHKLTEDLRQDMGNDAVYLAFMELSSPNLMDAAREIMATSVRKARLLPMFMAKGNHYKQDIPTQIAEVKAAFPELELELLEPIGLHPRFFELMREVIKGL
jgi:sirohydrochlorin cobaltochelatase